MSTSNRVLQEFFVLLPVGTTVCKAACFPFYTHTTSAATRKPSQTLLCEIGRCMDTRFAEPLLVAPSLGLHESGSFFWVRRRSCQQEASAVLRLSNFAVRRECRCRVSAIVDLSGAFSTVPAAIPAQAVQSSVA